MGDPRFELAGQVRRLVRTLRALAEYTRSLEKEIDGMTGDPDEAESWGGIELLAADHVLADFTHIEDASDE